MEDKFTDSILKLSSCWEDKSQIELESALEDIYILTTTYKNREKIAEVNYKYVPYQLCPKCNGTGRISSQVTTAFYQCDVCYGRMVIPMKAYE